MKSVQIPTRKNSTFGHFSQWIAHLILATKIGFPKTYANVPLMRETEWGFFADGVCGGRPWGSDILRKDVGQ